jgi:hypothetical protein
LRWAAAACVILWAATVTLAIFSSTIGYMAVRPRLAVYAIQPSNRFGKGNDQVFIAANARNNHPGFLGACCLLFGLGVAPTELRMAAVGIS